ncbi:MAG: CBS domain-containing protein [Desulfobacterales bacterium]|nr:CBS domain-containing protein [Desulfobacterales bacterium]
MSNVINISDKKELSVITTHTNADFDALGSMLAAQKIYPGSVVIFPGSQENNLRNFFISSMVYLFNMADVVSLEISKITQLIIVDTGQSIRIGKLAKALENKNIDIHIYDHHPDENHDIKADFKVNIRTGATVSILTEIIQKKNIKISPDEATIMCLGIYEDTGSFSYASTTDRDFMAAAFLLAKGANVNTITNLISREITPHQVSILNDLLNATFTYDINGVEIALSVIAREHYEPDFAFLVQKVMKMQNLNALFCICRMGNKIIIVARSRVPEVDVGAILSEIGGGGGHNFAASATIRDETLVQVEQRLFEIIYQRVKIRKQAKDILSSPAISVRPGIIFQEASAVLTRYNISSLLVTEKKDGKDILLGIISRKVVEKALHHGLSDISISEYMDRDINSVSPYANIDEIQEKIIENKQRILPVIDKGLLTGVISRTDLLKFLSQNLVKKTPEAASTQAILQTKKTRDINRLMKERLTNKILDILLTIGQIAKDIGYNVYVVGGFVRDLFLNRGNEDIDVVVEGDGILFAKRLAKRVSGRAHFHERFRTAVVTFPNEFKVDIATARIEYYKYPAALPDVETSSIKLDLFRRDFTINTLAIQLSVDKFGTLIDFFSAQRDIKDKTISVIHNLSFVEDPTRVFRAVRFEQRFGFTIGKITASLIENSVKMEFVKHLAGPRIFNEFRLILKEENPVPAIIRLNDFNLLKVIHHSLTLTKNFISLMNSIKKVLDWFDLLFVDEPCEKWMVYFLGILSSLDEEQIIEVVKNFDMPPKHSKIFCKDLKTANETLQWLQRNTFAIVNSTLYKKLYELKTELILYMMGATEKEYVKKAISQYYTGLRHIKLFIKGSDLLKIGLTPGPLFKRVLSAVLDAKLNDRIHTKEEELEFVKKYIEPKKIL